MAYVLNGKTLRPGRPFTGTDGTQYPGNWLRQTTLEEKEAIGITEVPDPEPVDNRFYWDRDADGNPIPKQLEDEEVTVWEDIVIETDGVSGIASTSRTYTQTGLKTQWKQEQDQTAYSLLSPTDWYVIRNIESGTEIPVGITSYRAAVRDMTNQRKAHIDTATSMESFIGITTFCGCEWPENPSL